MGFTTTSKTKIRNTILLLNEQPNYDSGITFNWTYIMPPQLKYSFDLPSYIDNVEQKKLVFYFTETYIDDEGFMQLNNKVYTLGYGWSLCHDFNNIKCSPLLNTSIEVTNFLAKNNELQFFVGDNLFYNFGFAYKKGAQTWLVLKEFKLFFSYVTK